MRVDLLDDQPRQLRELLEPASGCRTRDGTEREVNSSHVQLDPAGADPDQEAPAGENVESPHLLGEDDRIMLRKEADSHSSRRTWNTGNGAPSTGEDDSPTFVAPMCA